MRQLATQHAVVRGGTRGTLPALPGHMTALPVDESGVEFWHSALPDGQLGVINEMLRSLDTDTVAGQHYVMSKIVAFLQHEVTQRGRSLIGVQLRLCAMWLDEMAHEASKVMPDVGAFNRRADVVVRTLAGIP